MGIHHQPLPLRRIRFYREDYGGLWVPAAFIDLCRKDQGCAFWLAAACAYQQAVGDGVVWQATRQRWAADWGYTDRSLARAHRTCRRYVDPGPERRARGLYLVHWDMLEKAVAKAWRHAA